MKPPLTFIIVMPAKKKTSSPTTPAASESASPKKTAAKTAAKKAAAKKAPAAVAAVPDPVPALTCSDIERLAYLNYCSRKAKGLPDDPEGDWLAAERQLKVRK